MPYRSPVSEFQFLLDHVTGYAAVAATERFAEAGAETVAAILTEEFQVPAENLTTQGYGEQYLKVSTQEASEENRRVTIRRITPLLRGAERR